MISDQSHELTALQAELDAAKDTAKRKHQKLLIVERSNSEMKARIAELEAKLEDLQSWRNRSW